jgi:signal recognition particle subunit SRP54
MARRFVPYDYTLADFRRDMERAVKLSQSSVTGSFQGPQGDTPADLRAECRRLCGIIDAMTTDERTRVTEVIDNSRCRRIGAGAGVSPTEVEELVKQFRALRELMRAVRRLRKR